MKTVAKKLIALLAGAVLMANSATGQAAIVTGFYTGTLSIVEWQTAGKVLLQMPSTSEVNFLGQTAQPCTGGAPATTTDTLKVWASLGQAALLAGKSVRIYWTKCSSSGTPYITAVDLNAT